MCHEYVSEGDLVGFLVGLRLTGVAEVRIEFVGLTTYEVSWRQP